MRRLVAGVVVALAATVLSPAGLSLAAPSDSPSSEPASVPDQLLVGYRHGASEAHRAEARGRAKAELVDRVVKESGDRVAVELVKVKGIDRAEATRRFKSNPKVAFAEPNWIYTHERTPPTTLLHGRLALGHVRRHFAVQQTRIGSQAAEAWAAGNTGSDSVYVGIIDEGYQHTHPDLVDNAGTNPGETGFIGSVNRDRWRRQRRQRLQGRRIRLGLRREQQVRLRRYGRRPRHPRRRHHRRQGWQRRRRRRRRLERQAALGQVPRGRGRHHRQRHQGGGLLHRPKTRNGINLVATNNSWGGGGFSQALDDAISRANAENILFVAAAGNGGANNDTTPRYPSSYTNSNVIAVAAIDRNGPWPPSRTTAPRVDLGAPGVGIWSTLPGGTYGVLQRHVDGRSPRDRGRGSLCGGHPGESAASIRSAILSKVTPLRP